MWDKAGGSAENDAETLRKHKEDLTQLCNCILEGCTQIDLRTEAINMKANLLHATGDTEGALEILSNLPARHAPIAKEQLFGKDTAEYRSWNKQNCYGLMDVMAINLARMIRFDTSQKRLRAWNPWRRYSGKRATRKILRFSVSVRKPSTKV